MTLYTVPYISNTDGAIRLSGLCILVILISISIKHVSCENFIYLLVSNVQ